jgi:hypothetical protein
MIGDFWGQVTTVGVKTHPKELEGSMVVSPFLRGTDRIKHPMAKLFTKYRKKPLEDMSPFYLMGIATGLQFEAGVRQALKDVGYEKLDGEAFYQALQKLTGRKITQGITGKCDWSPTSRRGSREVKFYKVIGGKLVPITDWITAPDCVSLHKW